jgi:hypothetical protein
MPTVTNPNLTLSESNGIITMTIVFLPTFSNFEKELGSLGCTYDAHYSVHGVDNGLPGAELTAVDIPNRAIPVNRALPVLPSSKRPPWPGRSCRRTRRRATATS